MSRLAEVLDARREEIVRAWVERVARFHAPGPHSRTELADHIPQFLASLVHNLRVGRQERSRDYDSRSKVKEQGAEHGLQRFRIGFDLESMVREYGELREVLDDVMEQEGLQPSLDEQRVLGQSLAMGVAEAVAAFSAHQRLRLEEGRAALGAMENGDAFFLLDRDWRFVRVNQSQERLSHTRREDTLGRVFWDVFPETTSPELKYWRLYHQVMDEREPVAFEEYYAPLDLWTEVTAYPEQAGGIIVFFRDVTAKKKLETALRLSEERYQLASKATQEAIWDWNLVDNTVAWNEGVHTLFGYPPEQVGPGGEWWIEHIHPEDRERVSHDIHCFIDSAGAQRWLAEYRFLRTDGHYAQIVDRGYLARAEDGRALRMVGAMQDVTAQREAEAESERARKLERLRESQLLGLADAAAAIHGATSRDEVLLALTDHARTLVGAHQSVTSVTTDLDWSKAVTQASFSDKYASWRLRADRPDDSEIYSWVCRHHRPLRLTQGQLESDPRWLAGSTPPRDHPPLRGWLAVPLIGREAQVLGLIHLSDKEDGSDFSAGDESLLVQVARYASSALENVRLASETQAAEARTRIAVEATQLGTWDVDPQTNAVVWDARCKALFGLAPETPITYALFLAGLHPEDREPTDQAVRRSMEGGGDGGFHVEYRTVEPGTGKVRWLDARGRTFFDDTGKATRFTGTVLDITARKSLEAERVALLEREQAARTEAETANRLKDDFIATVSHELRTPLTAILGWVQILRSGQLPEERRLRALETVERNAHVQSQLVEDLLDISRIMSGKLVLEMERVELSAVVEAAVESIRPTAVAKDIRLHPAIDALSSVMGDSTRLQQIVWNLLSNAVKFTPKGGEVQILVMARGSSVEVVVSDTGKGIPADFLPHVFERFRQAEGSVARKYGGLGLGLSIVKHLVELHGGTIAVASEGEGRGATFTVRLPMVAARRPERVPAPPLEIAQQQEGLDCPTELNGLRLLLVDDEADTREYLRMVLERCHAQVETASSAAEGMELLLRTRPHVLVSDIGMPGEDGYAFIRKVRALPASKGGRVPAVALTAYARAEDRTRALLAGFKAHVPKPIQRAELLAVLISLAPSPEERT
ncbi:PAS domain-containing protein [Archangium primigenium]|uniref:PAS domain-containing protein n=1 Tax=[Archangium] primigenium TaxID=2792470 RepID=UPI00195DE75B|nr:PAS domain-containing protein [Archangium primigenium]